MLNWKTAKPVKSVFWGECFLHAQFILVKILIMEKSGVDAEGACRVCTEEGDRSQALGLLMSVFSM